MVEKQGILNLFAGIHRTVWNHQSYWMSSGNFASESVIILPNSLGRPAQSYEGKHGIWTHRSAPMPHDCALCGAHVHGTYSVDCYTTHHKGSQGLGERKQRHSRRAQQRQHGFRGFFHKTQPSASPRCFPSKDTHQSNRFELVIFVREANLSTPNSRQAHARYPREAGLDHCRRPPGLDCWDGCMLTQMLLLLHLSPSFPSSTNPGRSTCARNPSTLAGSCRTTAPVSPAATLPMNPCPDFTMRFSASPLVHICHKCVPGCDGAFDPHQRNNYDRMRCKRHVPRTTWID